MAAVDIEQIPLKRVKYSVEECGEHRRLSMVIYYVVICQFYGVLEGQGSGRWRRTPSTRRLAADAGWHAGQVIQQARGIVLLAESPQQAAEQGHEESGAHTLITNVAKKKPDAVAREREGIIEIACHLTRRLKAGRYLPSFRLRQHVGQKAELDSAGDLDIVFVLLAFFQRLFGQLHPLFLQVRPDTRPSTRRR